MDDIGDHCGGQGRLIEGSQNVLIGDWAGPSKDHARELHVALLDHEGAFVPGVGFEVKGPQSFSGTTRNEVLVFKGLLPGKYAVTFLSLHGVLPYGAPRRAPHGK